MTRAYLDGQLVSFVIVQPLPTVQTFMVEMWIGEVITPIFWQATTADAARAFIPKSCLTCVENKNPESVAVIETWY